MAPRRNRYRMGANFSRISRFVVSQHEKKRREQQLLGNFTVDHEDNNYIYSLVGDIDGEVNNWSFFELPQGTANSDRIGQKIKVLKATAWWEIDCEQLERDEPREVVSPVRLKIELGRLKYNFHNSQMERAEFDNLQIWVNSASEEWNAIPQIIKPRRYTPEAQYQIMKTKWINMDPRMIMADTGATDNEYSRNTSVKLFKMNMVNFLGDMEFHEDSNYVRRGAPFIRISIFNPANLSVTFNSWMRIKFVDT
jgi:hypothetical protein